MSARVFVIVLNYNGRDVNQACLESLRECSSEGFTVIFVDNGSTDGSYEEARAAFPEFTYLQNGENLYFAAGNNRAIDVALDQGADYVFILNNDTVLLPGCVPLLTAFMDAHPQAAACQPLLCAMADPQHIASAGCRLSMCGKGWDHLCGQPVDAAGTEPFEVLGVTGGAMLARASSLRQVGLFDESFQMYFEDVDLSLRMRSAGYTLHCVPAARVLHEISATTDRLSSWRRAYFCERNSWKLMLKNFPRWQCLKGFAVGIPASAAVGGYNILRGNVTYGWKILCATGQGVLSLAVHFAGGNLPRKHSVSFWRLVDVDMVYPPACSSPRTESRPRMAKENNLV